MALPRYAFPAATGPVEHCLPLALGPYARMERIAGTQRSDVYRAPRRDGNANVLPRWATVLGKIPRASKINGRRSVIGDLCGRRGRNPSPPEHQMASEFRPS